ncbi:LHFPL tetraspan subfamily member 2 protein [Petromyzon marinus]|uniref:LHFPL tetraspan subfamily member 2 protein n=1 Tax=Petromyzon marinus TaxID=7757 RepID=UPI003F6E8FDC
MCQVIVTCRSLLWTLLSIATAFAEMAAFLSTEWLVGEEAGAAGVVVAAGGGGIGGVVANRSTAGAAPADILGQPPSPATHHRNHHSQHRQHRHHNHSHHNHHQLDDAAAPHHLVVSPVAAGGGGGSSYRPSLGVYNRCRMVRPAGPGGEAEESCGPYAASFGELASGLWQASGVFLGAALLLLVLLALSSVLSLCVQSVARKSIFNVCGLVQAVAGLLLLLGLVLYAAGWGSPRVRDLCGPSAGPFRPASCSLGWAFYSALGATVGAFACAMLSAQAEVATSSDEVQEAIDEGKTLICLP